MEKKIFLLYRKFIQRLILLIRDKPEQIDRLFSAIAPQITKYIASHPYILSKHPSQLNQFLSGIRPQLIEMSETYPSAINSGYLHIEKAIKLKTQLNLIEPGLILDVGAASGVISEMFAKAFPQSTIYAFEPIGDSFAKLKEKTSAYSNIISINKALGSSSSEVEINVATRITSSSIFELNPGPDQNFITENIGLARKEHIFISTLDTEIPANYHVNILKLDVQGYELEVLKGGIATLERTYIVLVEVSNHNYYANGAQYYQIDDFLRKSGFQLFTLLPSLRENGKMLEWDSIYINTKLVSL